MVDMKKQWQHLGIFGMTFRTKTKQLDALLKELKNTLWQELTIVKRRKKLTEEINELWDSEETLTLI